MKIKQHSNRRQATSETNHGGLKCARCRREHGIALVITLIMLSVTLVMAVAFMALARREKGSVITTTDTKVAQLAAESGMAQAVAQINANALSGFRQYVVGGITNVSSSNSLNLNLIVSTNYINSYGFISGINSPTNVNYYYPGGAILNPADFVQNVANLWYQPRAPVMVSSNEPVGRFYLDLNENGRFDPNGRQTVISDDATHPYFDTNGVPQTTFNSANVLSNFFVGDPEWIGVLEHPDAPHGPNNHFTSRYAFIAVPAGNTMDINYIHNQARNLTTTPGGLLNNSDGFMRNQGVGSWEINLAAFLADLNTNYWGQIVGSGNSAPLGAGTYYLYDQPNNANSGYAFQDAFSLLSYRYNKVALPSANYQLTAPFRTFPSDGVDNYSVGPLQTTLDTNEDFLGPSVNTANAWSGADNTNHYFTLGDFFDSTKLPASFINRLGAAGSTTLAGGLQPSYDRYTFYRMLNELGTDSSPDDGKLNLNYSNAVVTYNRIGGVSLPTSVGIVPGAETNLVRWSPTNFFHAAADQLLRTYSSSWIAANYVAYTNTYAVTGPFGITNIPVWVSNRFVYTPAVHRLLQLAANIYDATTNGSIAGSYNFPHVYRPVLERVNNNGDIYIVGYVAVNSVSLPPSSDPQMQAPFDITQLSRVPMNMPITRLGVPINVYGVPWIIGAKKGFPNFNQLSMVTAAQVTRKLEVSRNSYNPATASYTTNAQYIMSISNSLGLSFWNSYNADYIPHTGPLHIYASDAVNMVLTNGMNGAGYYTWSVPTNFVVNFVTNSWPGSKWNSTQPGALPQNTSFISFYGQYPFQSPLPYNFSTHKFDVNGGTWWDVSKYPQLDQFGMLVTNYLQAYILDGNNVIDYVQLRDPISTGNLNAALADPPYPQPNNARLQWSTNAYSPPPVPWGVVNQIIVSESGPGAAAGLLGGQWSTAPTPTGDTSPQAEAAYFSGFFKPSYVYQGQTYINHQLATQAPYTPQRTVYSSYLLQANDPLVHTLASDLNSQAGALAVWGGRLPYRNGIWSSNDAGALPIPPSNPVNGRYQPWGEGGQMAQLGGTVDNNPFNLAYRDPLVWRSDDWDFPTNLYPSVGWIGRVHRGTPWQTVYLKSTNILNSVISIGGVNVPNGFQTWANWTGNIQTNIYAYFFDNANTAPQQDFLLFDIFTTRFNDNAVRGTLPVNVGAGQSDGGLAAWSALFGGMIAISNDVAVPAKLAHTLLQYTNLVINPAGVDQANSALWKIVNDRNYGINATRANTNLFPSQTFAHPGQILATPALSVASPFLNTNAVVNGKKTSYQSQYAINDEMYEWLPQQMMGLVRGSESRYVLYCFGQTLKPAPSGTVLSGPYFQLVTNYQVVAESVIRAVVRIDNASTAQPHAVVESYNVLPPN